MTKMLCCILSRLSLYSLTVQARAQTRRRASQQPCEICGKMVADLYKHRKTHTKRTPNSKSCDICGKRVVDLYRHRKTHSGLAPHLQSCNICGKFVVDMYKHKLVHRGIERPLRLCTVCGKSVKDLRRHRQTHDGVRRWQHCQQECDVCGKLVANIRIHRRTHEDHSQEHQCVHCGRHYSSDKSLKEHLRTHSTLKNFVCAECGRRYSSKTALSAHMWNHSVEPRYRCSVCGKTFRWNVTWKRHLWTHGIGISKSHTCVVCSKYFASPYLLRDHMRSHSGDKPFMCWQCGQRFAHKSSLLSHQKCFHSESKSACTECGKMIRAPRMPIHMRTVHRHILHSCPHCDLEFRQQDWCDLHILSHASRQPFVCKGCSDSKDLSLLDQQTDLCNGAGQYLFLSMMPKTKIVGHIANGTVKGVPIFGVKILKYVQSDIMHCHPLFLKFYRLSGSIKYGHAVRVYKRRERNCSN